MAIRWRKSSFSFSNGNCIEVAAWRTARACESGACVEVGQGTAVVGVRDTKDNGAGPVLTFGRGSWERFTAGVRSGQITADPAAR